MGGIVCAGYAGADIIKTISAFPERHGLVSVTNIRASLGGAVCNCALDLARLSPETTVKPMANIGYDEYGAAIMSEFGKFPNIDTSLIRREGRTGFTDVLDEAATRVRSFLVYRGANADFGVESVNPAKLDADIFHIGYICLLDALDSPDAEYGTQMARLLKNVSSAGIMTSVDVVTDSTGRHRFLMPAAMRYTDIMCVNEHEAGAAFGISLRDERDALIEARVPEVLRLFMDSGVRKWAIIHAPECAYGIDKTGEIRRAPGAILPDGYIKGTVGAGDAFVSGVLLGALRGAEISEAMEDGIAAAASSLSEPGASEGVCTLEEARRALAGFERRK